MCNEDTYPRLPGKPEAASAGPHPGAPVRQLPSHRVHRDRSLTKKPRYLRETAKTYPAADVALTRLQGDQSRHPKTNITLGQAITRWLEIARPQW
jgi:hypothetical protein